MQSETSKPPATQQPGAKIAKADSLSTAKKQVTASVNETKTDVPKTGKTLGNVQAAQSQTKDSHAREEAGASSQSSAPGVSGKKRKAEESLEKQKAKSPKV